MDIGDTVVRDIKEVLVSLEGKMPGFRRRECQLKMVNDIRQMLLNNSAAKNLVCELGLGAGKTLAYLLGVVPHALATEKKVVISTYSEGFQQHIKDEVMLFARAFSKSFIVDVVVDGGQKACSSECVSDADVIIVTHKTIARDMMLGGGVILPSPSAAVYIFDEADYLASEVRDYLSHAYCPSVELMHMSSDRWIRVCKTDGLTMLRANYVKALVKLEAKFAEYRYSLLKDGRTSHFTNGHVPASMSELAAVVLRMLNKLRDALSQLYSSSSTQIEKWCIEECDKKIGALSSMVSAPGGVASMAKWLEVGDDGHIVFRSAYLNLGGVFAKHYWSKNSGVVVTGSVLRYGGTFDSFARELGFEGQLVWYKPYGSPFHYEEQGTLVLPELKCEPRSEEFTIWLNSFLFQYLAGMRSSLVLFCSAKQMYQVRGHIEASCTNAGILLQCEGDRDKHELLENHAKAVSMGIPSVIFGTHQVLEGLRLKEELLVNLVIVRLPFEPLDSPLTVAQMEFERDKGTSPFEVVVLPKACQALMRAVGYLIQSESDFGRCVILDSRLKTKDYGARFLDSLPTFRRYTE